MPTGHCVVYRENVIKGTISVWVIMLYYGIRSGIRSARRGRTICIFTITIFTWELGYSKLKMIIPGRVDIRWFTRSHTHCILVEPCEDK